MTDGNVTVKRCAGHRTSGHWKGWPCGAVPQHKKGGKWWCKNHLPLGKKEK